MKIRSGFVSNSSSSSFACFGIPLDTDSKIEVFKKLVGYINKGTMKKINCIHEFTRDTFNFCPICGKKSWTIIDQDEDFKDGLDSFSPNNELNRLGLEVITGWLDDTEETVYFLGVNLEDNDKSGKETLDKINKANRIIMDSFPEKEQDQNFYTGATYK